ncbi:MAG: hypothetical protein NVS4B3_14780 [Gemmatimonadaceae bacterium]
MARRADISPLSRLIRRVDAASDGAPPPDTVTTGFPSLDKILGGGLRCGDLVVLGGDVSSGKSALALAIAMRSAQAGRRTLYLTTDASAERVLERMLAIEGRARVDDLRRGSLDDATRAGVGAAALRLRDAAPAIDRISGGPDAVAERLREASGVELVVLDCLPGLAEGRMAQDEELATAVRRLKTIALDRRIAIMVTAPLPRLARDRTDLRPRLDDFGARGAVKEHADVVLGLFREEMYDGGRGIEGATELAVCKNRDGATGYVDLYFYCEWLRFEDMLDPVR